MYQECGGAYREKLNMSQPLHSIYYVKKRLLLLLRLKLVSKFEETGTNAPLSQTAKQYPFPETISYSYTYIPP
jgi:hypothetical protein